VAATTPKSAGDHAETLALEHLQRHGLALVCRNYRVARGPHARGGEIDLIVREGDGTLCSSRFVRAPRARSAARWPASPPASGNVLAARNYLAGLARIPPCRFDVVAIEGARVQWVRGAFTA